MIKLEHIVMPSAEQMEFVIEGMRNPKNSWDKSDSGLRCSQNPNDICTSDCTADTNCRPCDEYLVGENDLSLMQKLSKAGTDHRKFMRMMPIMVRITAPLYWWKEFDTYKVGTVANSCSTMHKLMAKEFTREDFSLERVVDELNGEPIDTLIAMYNTLRDGYLLTTDPEKKKAYENTLIQLLLSSYNQTRNVMLNYEVLTNIFKSRKNHKLDEWREFCQWIETLTGSELITECNRGPLYKFIEKSDKQDDSWDSISK